MTTSSKLAKLPTPENERMPLFNTEHRSQSLHTSLENNGETPNDEHQQQQQQQQLDDAMLTSLTNETRRGASRKQHWKSQSVGETVQQQQDSLQQQSSNLLLTTSMISQEEEHEQTTFSANRELWQRRATSQSQLNPPVPSIQANKSYRTSQEFREMRQKHTPDLVMDLPLSAQDASKKSASSSSLSSSDDETTMITPVHIQQQQQQQHPSSDQSQQQPQQQQQQQLQQPSRIEAATSPTGGPESPDMSTAAERFAKQNQCTLKKNTKLEASKLKRLETTEGQELELDIPDEIVRSSSSTQISSDLQQQQQQQQQPLRSPLPPRSTPKIVAKFADMHLTGGSQMSSFKPQVKVKPAILRKPVLPFPHPHMSPELARKIEKQAQSSTATTTTTTTTTEQAN